MYSNNQGNANQPIDQLWYTWSTIGLSSVTAGFRILAASGSLAEVSSPQVQDLDKYLRYILPEGSGRIEPSRAPLSLSFFQTTNGRRILLNKTYTGRDGVGRPGAFFAHLLADLPTDFTVRDAILLWRSPFWQSSDASIGGSLHLQPISVEELRSRQLPLRELNVLNPLYVDYAQSRIFLPFFIRSYLMWRTDWERGDQLQAQEPKHLYIAAPADLVAAFLLALTVFLPDALLEGLTFSTYEKEVQVQGLSMPLLTATTFSEEAIGARKDLPLSCYQEHVALNCYTGKYSNLDSHPLISLASSVSEDIARRLEEPQSAVKKFETFRKGLAYYSRVDVEVFLHAYDQFILREHEPPSKERFVAVLQNPLFAVDYLGDESWREFGLQLAVDDRVWGRHDLPEYLEALCQHKQRLDKESDTELDDALTRFAISAACGAEDAIQRGDPSVAVTMHKIMSTISPKGAPNNRQVWNKTLFRLEQRPGKNIRSFFKTYRSLYLDFLDYWAITLPKDKYYLIESFLLIRWESKEEDEKNKETFLRILLSSPVSDGREERIIETANPNSTTIVWLLQRCGPSYLRQNAMETPTLKYFANLGVHNKMQVLYYWLRPRSGSDWREQEFVAWLEGPTSWMRLEKILSYALLTPSESAQFLMDHGEYYLRNYESRYVASFPETNMARYIRDYLKNVNPDILLQPPSAASAFLLFLSRDYFQHLPEDVRKEVSKFSRVNDILMQPGTCKDMVIAFAKQVHHVSPVILERFAEQLAERITNETEFAIVFGTMMTFTQLFTPFNLMQILYDMAETVRDTAAKSESKWDRRLIPYVNFALHSDILFSEQFFSGESYPRFMYTFLDALLAGADEGILGRVEQSNTSSWTDRTAAKWQEYRSRKKMPVLSTAVASPTNRVGVHPSSPAPQEQARYFGPSPQVVGKQKSRRKGSTPVDTLKGVPVVGGVIRSWTGELGPLRPKKGNKGNRQANKT
jgi:hypothetical protein